jgi:hypothetical protein
MSLYNSELRGEAASHVHVVPMFWRTLQLPALCWALTSSSVSYIFFFFTQTVGLLGRVISPSHGCYLNTEQHKHRINAYTNIHALSGIRNHDPSVRAGEDTVHASDRVTTVIAQCTDHPAKTLAQLNARRGLTPKSRGYILLESEIRIFGLVLGRGGGDCCSK